MKTAPTSVGRGLPTMRPTICTWRSRTWTAAQTITAGRTTSVSWRAVRRYSIRSEVRGTISAFSDQSAKQCTPASLAQILARMSRSARAGIPAAANHVTAGDRGGELVLHRHRLRAELLCRGPVQRGAALYTLEGDFGFSPPNATAPAPEVGHEVKLINFSNVGEPLVLKIMNFARNVTGDGLVRRGHRSRPSGVQSSAQRQIRTRRLRLGH